MQCREFSLASAANKSVYNIQKCIIILSVDHIQATNNYLNINWLIKNSAVPIKQWSLPTIQLPQLPRQNFIEVLLALQNLTLWPLITYQYLKSLMYRMHKILQARMHAVQ